jgi:hypothetical protein
MSQEIITPPLESALWLAGRGFPVFPLNWVHELAGKMYCTCTNKACQNQGKHPHRFAPHGLKDATVDISQIQRWWHMVPQANVGAVTGAIVAVDVDPRHAGDHTLRTLETEHGELPLTWRVITGGGGEHIFFKTPPGAVIGNSVGKLGRGVDVKGLGGYVVAPPSLHISGRRYAWSVDHHPDEIPVAPLPEWILNHLREPTAAVAAPPSAWRSLVINGVDDGGRNNSIARLAGHLLRRRIDPHVVCELLQSWNQTHCRPPKPASEVKLTIESICRKELQRRIDR